MCFCDVHWVQQWSAKLPVPLACTTKLPAPHDVGVHEAAQWLPSGHYMDQLYEVELQSLAEVEQWGISVQQKEFWVPAAEWSILYEGGQ